MNIEVRGLKSAAAEQLRGHAGRRLRFARGRFAYRIKRVLVHLSDTNGHNDGLDRFCELRARLIDRREVVVGDVDTDWHVLIDRVSDRFTRSVARLLECEHEASEPRLPWGSGRW